MSGIIKKYVTKSMKEIITNKSKRDIKKDGNQANLEVKTENNKNKGENVIKKDNKNESKDKISNDVNNNLIYKKLRKKLNNLNYNKPLCVGCTPLVQAVFDDLIQAIQNFQKISDKYEDARKKYKDLISEQKKNGLPSKDPKVEKEDMAGNKSQADKSNTELVIKGYKTKVEKLKKQLEEELKTKESYISENKKLKLSLEILEKNTKEYLCNSSDCTSDNNLSSFNNKTKSFDDFELEKEKKKKKHMYMNNCMNESNSNLINNHILSWGKELSYYKKLCKELKIELEKAKIEPNTMHSDNIENQDNEKDMEIKNLKKKLNEYEVEIKKMNELRMLNDKNKTEHSTRSRLVTIISNDSRGVNSKVSDDNTNENSENSEYKSEYDGETKTPEATKEIKDLEKVIKQRDDEIFHLQNRVVLLETELQVKNEQSNKYKEKLKSISETEYNELSNGLNSSVSTTDRNQNETSANKYMSKSDEFSSYSCDEVMHSTNAEDLMDERKSKDPKIDEMKKLLEKIKKELNEEKKKSNKYEREYNKEKGEVSILKEELKILEKKIEKKRNEFNIDKNIIKNFKLESDEFNNIISCSNETKKQLTDYIHNILNTLSEYNDKIDELKNSNMLQDEKIQVYKKEIKKLKDDLIDSSNQIDEFASLLDKKDEVIESFKNKLEILNKEYAESTLKFNEILKENKNLQLMNTSHNANSSLVIQQLQQEIQILNVTNNHLLKIEEDYKIVLQEKTIVEDAAIKIQTELKKSVDKIKNLETYIQTLSIEIANLKTQRDDSLDALTKVAIDKTQYENELIQSKSIIDDLKRKLNEYEKNVLFVQNNISEISKINIKKEQEEIILKNEIKSLRENLNEKTIKLELLQEKENTIEQNNINYNKFHLEAHTKYNYYEQIIHNLKKEIDELTINNNDNIVIIERLKSELNNQEKMVNSQRRYNCSNDLIRNQKKNIKSISGNSINIDRDDKIMAIENLKNIISNTKGEYDNHSNASKQVNSTFEENREIKNKEIINTSNNLGIEITSFGEIPFGDAQFVELNSSNPYPKGNEEEEIYDYNDGFTIFLNSNKKKEEKVKNDELVERNILVSGYTEGNFMNLTNEHAKKEGNDKIGINRNDINKTENKRSTFDDTTKSHENKMLYTDDEDFIYNEFERDEFLMKNEYSKDFTNFSNCEILNADTLSYMKRDNNKMITKKNDIKDKSNNIDSITTENVNGQSASLLKDMTLSSLNNVSNEIASEENEEKEHDQDFIASEYSFSYLENNDISLFSSSKIKKMFNLNSTNNMRNHDDKNVIDKTFPGERSANVLKKNNNLNNSNIKNIYQSSGRKNKKYNTEIKDSYGDMIFDVNDSTYFDEDNDNKKNMKGKPMEVARTEQIRYYDQSEIGEHIDNKNNNIDISTGQPSRYDVDSLKNGLQNSDMKRINHSGSLQFSGIRDMSDDKKINHLIERKKKIEKSNKYKKKNNSVKNNKGCNFISQTSYEANSNSSSVLLDSVNSDFSHNISIDQYNDSNSKRRSDRKSGMNYSKHKHSVNNLKRGETNMNELNRSKGIYENYDKISGEKYKNDNGDRKEKDISYNSINDYSYRYKENAKNYSRDDISVNSYTKNPGQNRAKTKQELYNKYMDVLKNLKSEEIDASVDTNNNRTIDLTNDFTKTHENSTSILSSMKTLQKDSIFSNLSKLRFNEEMLDYNCDPLVIIKPLEESNMEDNY
ncbi:conserved Plasmodium protein, unknown function [Plasmodium berghei]|uniref:Uncharacterized protein n=2 Tax=Plasmodium berghei TaxID=5821 RepID=A0A509AP63_PLABA|nr:conserved Plasmodium protein, unknown function [Plasmodium berghei ANKA]SCM25757.1 conserved Plasmodium protein, unknown function [Plasmodium berghei]SCN27484.1 conserved Plasmodium protein, unknown function [Plasmodium berghei]SCO63911.1 conserved Plasmodium protein, unknown function [Plasmodium berghei]VUC57338.1 conserved Plasmodium protein, unknown function [Plasmodium berghei ANKA]|eukprot:XP_034423116.1 conserved Plasmodium protein, unknown function [Plasmodium berghei ANKA]